MVLLPLTVLLLGSLEESLAFKVPLAGSDIGLNTVEIIENHGYVCENHYITTEDGYILTYQRIPHGQNDDGSGKKPAVFLMHGAASSSADFVNMGPERSLGYILADIGYDVWLGNGRGNAWSRNHTTLDIVSNARQFFDFSWHEMGYYDLPAAIDYILNVNGDDSLYYVGHSQGTTVFLVLASTRPEYNEKIRIASLMAPISSMENQSNELLLLMSQYIDDIEALFEGFQIYEIPYVEAIQDFASGFCAQPKNYALCEAVIFQAIGADEPQLDTATLPVILTNLPSNTALKEFYHFAQQIRNGDFCLYDYGAEKNLGIYGTEKPPTYDLSKITTPVALYYGKNDAVVNPLDATALISKLPNVANDLLVPYDSFNHIDFVFAKDVVDLLYVQLIKVMQTY